MWGKGRVEAGTSCLNWLLVLSLVDWLGLLLIIHNWLWVALDSWWKSTASVRTHGGFPDVTLPWGDHQARSLTQPSVLPSFLLTLPFRWTQFYLQFKGSLGGKGGTKAITYAYYHLRSLLIKLCILHSTLIGPFSECSTAKSFWVVSPLVLQNSPSNHLSTVIFTAYLLLITIQFPHGSLRSPNQQRLMFIPSERSILNTNQFFKYLCWEL